MPWETNFGLFGHFPCLLPRGKSSCCNVPDRSTWECGTMQRLVGHAYCCNRSTSSAHAATCKKLAYRLNKPGKLKYSWWGQPLVQGMVMWASSMCLEFEAGCWPLAFAPAILLEGPWGDSVVLSRIILVTVTLHDWHLEVRWASHFTQTTTFLSGLKPCSWPLLRWIWAWRMNTLLQQLLWATKCPVVLQSDQAFLPRNHK